MPAAAAVTWVWVPRALWCRCARNACLLPLPASPASDRTSAPAARFHSIPCRSAVAILPPPAACAAVGCSLKTLPFCTTVGLPYRSARCFRWITVTYLRWVLPLVACAAPLPAVLPFLPLPFCWIYRFSAAFSAFCRSQRALIVLPPLVLPHCVSLRCQNAALYPASLSASACRYLAFCPLLLAAWIACLSWFCRFCYLPSPFWCLPFRLPFCRSAASQPAVFWILRSAAGCTLACLPAWITSAAAVLVSRRTPLSAACLLGFCLQTPAFASPNAFACAPLNGFLRYLGLPLRASARFLVRFKIRFTAPAFSRVLRFSATCRSAACLPQVPLPFCRFCVLELPLDITCRITIPFLTGFTVLRLALPAACVSFSAVPRYLAAARVPFVLPLPAYLPACLRALPDARVFLPDFYHRSYLPAHPCLHTVAPRVCARAFRFLPLPDHLRSWVPPASYLPFCLPRFCWISPAILHLPDYLRSACLCRHLPPRYWCEPAAACSLRSGYLLRSARRLRSYRSAHRESSCTHRSRYLTVYCYHCLLFSIPPYLPFRSASFLPVSACLDSLALRPLCRFTVSACRYRSWDYTCRASRLLLRTPPAVLLPVATRLPQHTAPANAGGTVLRFAVACRCR